MTRSFLTGPHALVPQKLTANKLIQVPKARPRITCSTRNTLVPMAAFAFTKKPNEGEQGLGIVDMLGCVSR